MYRDLTLWLDSFRDVFPKRKKKKKRFFQPEVERLETRRVLSSSVDFSAAAYTVSESAGSKTITVNIDQAVTQTSTIDYATGDGKATAGSDYTSASGTLTWEPLDGLSKTFNVSITSDTVDELGETISLHLSNPTGDIVLGSTYVSILTIDDAAPSTWAVDGPWEANPDLDVRVRGVSLQDGSFETGHTTGAQTSTGNGNLIDNFSPVLVYNSNSANARPIIEFVWQGNASDPVPTNLKARLTWNDGTPQSWVTFNTSGHSAGDAHLMAVQVDTAVTSSGFYRYVVDLEANFSGAPTQITRSIEGYVPVQVNGNAYGKGWTVAGLDRLIVSGVDGGVLLARGSGELSYFANAGGDGNQYTSPDGDLGTLVKNGDGTYTYTDHFKYDYNFDSDGYLTTIEDLHGLALTFAYSSNLLSTVTEPGGDVFTFAYSSGELSTITRPGDLVTTFTINGSDNLTVIENADQGLRTFTYDGESKMTKDEFASLVTSVSYDSTNDTASAVQLGDQGALTISPRLVVGLDTALNLSSDDLATTTDGNSNVTTFTLNADGQTTKMATADGNDQEWIYNADGQVTEYTDGRDNRTTYTYSGGNLTGVEDALGNVYTYTYNTNFNRVATEEDPLGNVTSYGYDATTGDLLTVTDALNKVTTYTWSNGLMQTMEDANSNVTSFTYTAGRRLQVIEDALNNKMTFGYDSAGNRTTVEDPLGNVTTFSFDNMGRQTVVEDPLGGLATILYDAAGLVTGFEDANGHLMTYSYDSAGRLTVVESPDGNITSVYDDAGNLERTEDANGNVTTFVYDALNRATVTIDALSNRTTTYYDAAGNVEAVEDARGNITTVVYDALNRATVTIDALNKRTTASFDAAGNLQTIEDANNNVTTYVYDALGRATVTIDALSNRTTSSFDDAGNLETIKDANGNVTTFVYDALNRASVTIDALNKRTTTYFDAGGNVEAMEDANNNVTTYVYDALNRATVTIDALNKRTTTYFDAVGNLEAVEDANGNITTYVYDAMNRATVTIDALGNRTTSSYDVAGNLETIEDANGTLTTLLYDALNRMTATIGALNYGTTMSYLYYDAVGNVEAVEDANNNVTTYLYDALNRATVTIDALNNRTTTSFDDAGNLQTIEDELGNVTTFVYDALNRASVTIDALGNRTTSSFDDAGNLETVEDADNNVTTYVYDALNRASVTIDANSDRTTTYFDDAGNVKAVEDANNNVTTYVYDVLNRVSVTIDANDYRTTVLFDPVGNVTSVKDASNNTTTFAFDALGRKTSETDPHGNTATFAYNAIGLLTGTTDRLNRERVFEYDVLNRLTTQIWKNSGGSAVHTLTYSFDTNSNMLTAADSSGAATTTYDTYTMTYDALNRVATAQDMWGHTLTFTYNAVGQRIKVEDSLGGVLTSTYNAVGNLTKREFKDGTPELRLDFAYTALNQVSDITRYSDLSGTTKVATSSFTYDASARIDHLQQKDGGGTNIANYTYTFDSVGNLATEILNGTTTTYVHDDTNQLTDDGTNTFSYDGTGNRTNTGYSTGTGNQIISDGTWTFSYDDEGNMVKKSKGVNAETWTYGYDHRNQMVWVQQRETYGGTLMMRADYEYDVFGNRIQKEVDEDGNSTVDLTERYAYDGWRPGGGFVGNENWDIWADLDDSSSLTTRYVRGDAIDEVFARIESDDSIYWLLTDRLGSVRDVTNNSGVVKDTIVYDGFGGISSETDSSFRGRYAWTGRELDTETELQYNRARYYDASIGRWTSQDPLGFDAGDSNLYRYLHNRPKQYTDPSGLQVERPQRFAPLPSPGSLKFDSINVESFEAEAEYRREKNEILKRINDKWVRNAESYRNRPENNKWGGQSSEEAAKEFWNGFLTSGNLLDIATMLIPGVNDGRDGAELYTGKDAIYGKRLTPFQHGATAFGTALIFVPASGVRHGARWFDELFGFADEGVALGGRNFDDFLWRPWVHFHHFVGPGGGMAPRAIRVRPAVPPAGAALSNHHAIPHSNARYNHEFNPLVVASGVNLKEYARNQRDLINHLGRHERAYHLDVEARLDEAWAALNTAAFRELPPVTREAVARTTLDNVIDGIYTDIGNGSLWVNSRPVWLP